MSLGAKKVMVVGQGSIGERHARILREMGHEVQIISRRLGGTIEQGLEWRPHYVVVATETANHAVALAELVQFEYRGRILIEKPLECSGFADVVPESVLAQADVGYNLRFHPLVQKLKTALDQELTAGGRIVSASFAVGQNLETWRTNRDYRESYSANANAGGGALRDLSHELDAALWFFGTVESTHAIRGHFSDLETQADDTVKILAKLKNCPALAIELDCVSRPGFRTWRVETTKHSYSLDLIKNELRMNGEIAPYGSFQGERDFTYRAMHQAVLTGNRQWTCTYHDAIAVDAWILKC